MPRSRPGAAALLVAALVVAAGCGAPDTMTPAPPAGPAAAPLGPAGAVPSPTGQVPDPERVRIPAIGVDAPMVPLIVDAAGVLPPPDTNTHVGWHRLGQEPGEVGPAVLAGHVDSYQGPAVFYRLRELAPGDRVLVDRVDGSTAEFAVTRVAVHPKDAFPTGDVYGPTPVPEVRLVTCGGAFNDTARSYADNVIVYAVATSG